MSVFVSNFAPGDGTWIVVHDELGHSGSIQPTDVVHTLNMDGSHNHNYASVTCPVCGAVSTHPVGGGAQPALVQQMFVTMCQTAGCPCGQIAEADPDGLGESHVRLQVNRMDGEGRWQLG